MRNALASHSPRRLAPVRKGWSMSKFLTAETKLSYADLEHMNITKRSKRHLQRVVPAWTASRAAIQAVVSAKLKRFARYIGCEQAEVDKASDLADLEVLARKAQREMRRFDNPRFPSYHVAAHLKSVESRSLAALWIYEIYSAYRLGHNSVEIARALSITPWAVRQHLHRLNQVARQVCPELCAPTRDYGGKYSRETYLDSKIAKAERLLEQAKGKRVPVYAARLAELRKMKEQRDGERNRATVFSSANRAAA